LFALCDLKEQCVNIVLFGNLAVNSLDYFGTEFE